MCVDQSLVNAPCCATISVVWSWKYTGTNTLIYSEQKASLFCVPNPPYPQHSHFHLAVLWIISSFPVSSVRRLGTQQLLNCWSDIDNETTERSDTACWLSGFYLDPKSCSLKWNSLKYSAKILSWNSLKPEVVAMLQGSTGSSPEDITNSIHFSVHLLQW